MIEDYGTESRKCRWCNGSGVIDEHGKAPRHECTDCCGTGYIDYCLNCGRDAVNCECRDEEDEE